jgi:hypothetical protein
VSPADNGVEQSIDHGDRSSLEAAHKRYLDRLHRSSGDFEATEGLKLVIAALQRLPPRGPTITPTSK